MGNLRVLFGILSLAVLIVAAAGRAGAQDNAPLAYPHDIVILVTHSSPGGGSDVFLRQMMR